MALRMLFTASDRATHWGQKIINEYLYNPKGCHSTMGYLSPVKFETKAALAWAAANQTGVHADYMSIVPVCAFLVALVLC